jgi:phosphopantothenate---cysteine ligase (CTP)
MKKAKKKVLVTAGATTVPIDQVRAISNIFKGRTGTEIARHFAKKGHEVTLITSNPDLLEKDDADRMRIIPYKTYDQLLQAMEKEIVGGGYDVVIHSAAVSDYKVDGVFYKDGKGKLVGVDNSKKMSSDHAELFLRLVPTEKIVDKIRKPWGFKGYLVKFKLQVGISDDELKIIADKSRRVSQADMIVANCLEWARERAEIRTENSVIPVRRKDLAKAMRKEMGL